MQAVLMRYVLDVKNHQLALPNLRSVYRWEMDLFSVTRAWLTHEYEIKVTLADFRADAKKRAKHQDLALEYINTGPNYFWYAIGGFELSADEVPSYAGLLRVYWHERWQQWTVAVERQARRRHPHKMPERYKDDLLRWLSYRVKKSHVALYETPQSAGSAE